MTRQQSDPITVGVQGVRVAMAVAILGLTGCTIDAAGNVRWTRPSMYREYDDLRAQSRHGHHGEPTVRHGGLDLRNFPIDTSKFTVDGPK